ncbi:MAG: ATP-binding protein [Anaerolineae bacterium]|nr:ATP-binding protein [Anaerolineae bacterium]
MDEVYGNFKEPQEGEEYLIIRFSPSSVPLKQRWRNNGLSADFLAEYWATFFPAHDIASQHRQLEIKGAVNYIANELLENVMKFSYSPSTYSVDLGLYLFENEFRFYARNPVAPSGMPPLRARIQRLLSEDPMELYLQQIEENAVAVDGTVSQLGLLTMLTDYDAELAWKFESREPTPGVEIFIVTTMVSLSL